MEVTEQLKFIDDNLIEDLNQLAAAKIEYWDIRCSESTGTSLDFTDQRSKEISSYLTHEASIRTFINGGWGFLVLNEISKPKIKEGFSKAIKLARLSESLTKTKFKIQERDPLIQEFHVKCQKNLDDIDITEKIKLIKEHEKIASEYSPQIKNTRTIYSDGHAYKLFLNSFGSRIDEDFSLLRMFNQAYAQKNGVLQRANNSVGGIGGFEIIETEKANKISLKSAREAVELLDAVSPVGGKFTVIMDCGMTGVFIHENQHASEADLVLNEESIYKDLCGKVVGTEDVTIIDDPRMGRGNLFKKPYDLFGSYFIDSEGTPSQKTTIIENGKLVNYLHSIETASRMGVEPNGHGRAGSVGSRPQVRMGVTYLEPKDWAVEEMIEDVREGILCKDFQYGYTDPSSGNFQFKCKLSYKIKNGEVRELMRDVSLSGMLLESLLKITAIGKKMNYSDGVCGKGGQGVNVCDGGPYTRIEEMTVGGIN